MANEEFKKQIIQKLGIEQLSAEEQEQLLGKVELLANAKLANALPELLSDEQFDQIEKMRSEGKSDDDILSWTEEQIPNYTEIMQTMIEDIAQDLVEGTV